MVICSCPNDLFHRKSTLNIHCKSRVKLQVIELITACWHLAEQPLSLLCYQESWETQQWSKHLESTALTTAEGAKNHFGQSPAELLWKLPCVWEWFHLNRQILLFPKELFNIWDWKLSNIVQWFLYSCISCCVCVQPGSKAPAQANREIYLK